MCKAKQHQDNARRVLMDALSEIRGAKVREVYEHVDVVDLIGFFIEYDGKAVALDVSVVNNRVKLTRHTVYNRYTGMGNRRVAQIFSPLAYTKFLAYR